MLELNQLVLGDCLEGMKDFPDKYFQLGIVDIPYGIGASSKVKYYANAFTQYSRKEWDNKKPSIDYFNELFRITQDQIIWGGNYFTDKLPPSKNWIVWDKKQPEGVSFSMHELAYYSGDGQAKIFRHYHGGNRCVVKEKSQKYIKIHPTQKPIALYKWILKNYCKPGDKIIDTHVGSGSSIIAFIDEGFDYIGFEIDSDYHKAASHRIAEFQKQGKLFGMSNN